MCPDCAEPVKRKMVAQETERRFTQRAGKFIQLCPELYRQTDENRLPRQFHEVMGWQYGAKGLLLYGSTGKSKTRCAWKLVERLMMDGHDVIHFDCCGFEQGYLKAYREDRAPEWADEVANVDIVFFDDLGKLRITDRAEAELFGVIERRAARMKPIICTTEYVGKNLTALLSAARGPALLRRLREFSHTINFDD